MMDLKDFLNHESHSSTQSVSVKPNLQELDRQISVVITELIPMFIPFYDRCFCVDAAIELGTSCLIVRFEALEAARAVKTASLHELTTGIIFQKVRQRAGDLKVQIEDLCRKRDRASSEAVGNGLQQQITQKTKELAPLRTLLREHKELIQELQVFSSHALVDLCRTLRGYLTSVEDWETLSRTVRLDLRDRILTLARLEEQRVASVSDLLGEETEA